MPGVYFVTTHEPISGQKTQVTAVFPGRNQSVAVKADKDRKMAEMSLPQKDSTVQFVDRPYSLITPSEHPSCHPYDYPSHPYFPPHHPYNQYYPPSFQPPPPPFQFPYYHSPFSHLPAIHQSFAIPAGFPVSNVPRVSSYVQTSQPILQATPQTPWSTPILPPIASRKLKHPTSAPATIEKSYNGSDSSGDEISDEIQGKRKLRDILLIDDSVIRSMNGRDKMSRRKLRKHNAALRVIQESPINTWQ